MEQQRAEAVDVQYTLEEEQKVIEGQDAAIQKAIELEQQRQAELKRQQEELEKQAELKRQQEEEAATATRQQVETAKQQQPKQQAPATDYLISNTSSNKTSSTAVSSSNFIRPTQGVVTSGFGYRIHPVHGGKKFHHGVDMAKAGTCSSCGFSFWGCFLFWANERLWKCDYYYSFH